MKTEYNSVSEDEIVKTKKEKKGICIYGKNV